MPDPTNPNTPTTTASNPMASAPSWEQFVGQYYKPQDARYFNHGIGVPTFLDPFSGAGVNFLTGRNDPNSGWAALINSGLLNQYGITTPNEFLNYSMSLPGSDRRASGVNIIQQAFRDWQLQQMQQQQQAQPQQQPTEAQAVQPQQQTPAQILSAFSQAASSTPQPLGNYASLLAAMNAVPQQAAQQQVDPLASWIMQYLRG